MPKRDDKYSWIEEIAKAVLDNVGIGISIISPRMQIIWLNKKYRENFPKINFRKQPLPLCYKSFYYPPRKKICSYCPTIKAFKTGKVHRADTDICTDGKMYNLIATPVKNKHGDTPLHHAVSYGDSELVKILLDHGADINAKDNRGQTPLKSARRRKKEEIVKLLLKHGAKE